MTILEAIEFAAGKLSNEVERDFDGSDVDDAERADYFSAVAMLEDFARSGMTSTFWRAEVQTSHFTFEGYGATEAQARAALMRAWRVHVRATGATPSYVQAEDANVLEFTLGQGYMDGAPRGKRAST